MNTVVFLSLFGAVVANGPNKYLFNQQCSSQFENNDHKVHHLQQRSPALNFLSPPLPQSRHHTNYHNQNPLLRIQKPSQNNHNPNLLRPQQPDILFPSPSISQQQLFPGYNNHLPKQKPQLRPEHSFHVAPRPQLQLQPQLKLQTGNNNLQKQFVPNYLSPNVRSARDTKPMFFSPANFFTNLLSSFSKLFSEPQQVQQSQLNSQSSQAYRAPQTKSARQIQSETSSLPESQTPRKRESFTSTNSTNTVTNSTYSPLTTQSSAESNAIPTASTYDQSQSSTELLPEMDSSPEPQTLPLTSRPTTPPQLSSPQPLLISDPIPFYSSPGSLPLTTESSSSSSSPQPNPLSSLLSISKSSSQLPLTSELTTFNNSPRPLPLISKPIEINSSSELDSIISQSNSSISSPQPISVTPQPSIPFSSSETSTSHSLLTNMTISPSKQTNTETKSIVSIVPRVLPIASQGQITDKKTVPLQSSKSFVSPSSSYQADSRQEDSLQQIHGEILDDVIISRVQNALRDHERQSPTFAGQPLVSGVSLDNARPSREILSFVHTSPSFIGSSPVRRFSSVLRPRVGISTFPHIRNIPISSVSQGYLSVLRPRVKILSFPHNAQFSTGSSVSNYFPATTSVRGYNSPLPLGKVQNYRPVENPIFFAGG